MVRRGLLQFMPVVPVLRGVVVYYVYPSANGPLYVALRYGGPPVGAWRFITAAQSLACRGLFPLRRHRALPFITVRRLNAMSRFGGFKRFPNGFLDKNIQKYSYLYMHISAT